MIDDDGAPCRRCADTGWITVRTTSPMAYVRPGQPPEGAKGVVGQRCWDCDAALRKDRTNG